MQTACDKYVLPRCSCIEFTYNAVYNTFVQILYAQKGVKT